MNLDWKKLGVYLAVAIAAAVVYTAFDQPPRPALPEVKPPVVVEKPVPPVVKPPVPPPPVEKRVLHKKPVPLPRHRPSHFKFKPPNQDLRCRQVPREAYEHPTDVVIETARRMGVPDDVMAMLKWCIGA